MTKVDWAQDLLRLIGEGKTKLEIVRIQKLGYEIINRRIHKLDETLLKEAMQKGQAKREATMQKEQDEILGLMRQGKKYHEIAEAFDVKQTDISLRIKEIDQALINAAINEAIQQGLSKQGKRAGITEEDILELTRQGKKQCEMADILGVSNSTITIKMMKIDQALLDKAINEAVQQGLRKPKKQIKETIIEEKEKEKKEHSPKEKKVIIDAKTIQEKMDKKEITVDDVKEYRLVIDEKYDKVTHEEVILLVNAYIRTKQPTEAIRFLNTTINNEDLAYLDIEKLKHTKTQVEQIQKKQTVRKLLRAGGKVSNIMQQTGLEETEVLAIKREMENKLGIEI